MTCLVKQVMLIHEHTLDKFESKCFMEVLKLQELWLLAIVKKTQILKDRECITHCRS